MYCKYLRIRDSFEILVNCGDFPVPTPRNRESIEKNAVGSHFVLEVHRDNSGDDTSPPLMLTRDEFDVISGEEHYPSLSVNGRLANHINVDPARTINNR